MKYKKWIGSTIVGTLLLTAAPLAFASPTNPIEGVKMHKNDHGDMVNTASGLIQGSKEVKNSLGDHVNTAGGTNQAGLIILNGKTMDRHPAENSLKQTVLPVRVILETLGYGVKWNSEAQQINISKNGQAISIQIGKDFEILSDNSSYVTANFLTGLLYNQEKIEWDRATNNFNFQNAPVSDGTESNAAIENIKKLAQAGKVPNMSYGISDDISKIDLDLKNKQLSNSFWYYPDQHTGFLANVGEIVYDVRSFDPELLKLTLSQVKGTLGTPDLNELNVPYVLSFLDWQAQKTIHSTKLNEEVLTYMVTDTYRLEFHFEQANDPNNDPHLLFIDVVNPNANKHS